MVRELYHNKAVIKKKKTWEARKKTLKKWAYTPQSFEGRTL